MIITLPCGMVLSSKTRIRCIFCGVFIPKASKSIEQHLNGAKHIKSIQLIRQQGIVYINGALHCRLCIRELPVEECVVKHIDSDDHLYWIAAIYDLTDGEFVAVDGFLSNEQDFAYCKVCNINLPCTLQVIEEHVTHTDHRRNIVARLKPLNGMFAEEGDEVVWCKVCDVYLEHTDRNILVHIDDDEQHMDWFTIVHNLIEGQEISVRSFLAERPVMSAYCRKCHMQIFCSIRSIQSHINGEMHMNQFGL